MWPLQSDSIGEDSLTQAFFDPLLKLPARPGIKAGRLAQVARRLGTHHKKTVLSNGAAFKGDCWWRRDARPQSTRA